MTPRDQINRAAKTLTNFTRDQVQKILMKERRQGNLKLEEKEFERLINVMSQTIDAAYHANNKAFMTSVDGALKESTSPSSELDAKTSPQKKAAR